MRTTGRVREEGFDPSWPGVAIAGRGADDGICGSGKSCLGAAHRRVYEADPLECPRYKGPMRVIALIEDPGAIRCIREHLGQRAPLAAVRGPPPRFAANWPRHANLPLTYHPVPDIA